MVGMQGIPEGLRGEMPKDFNSPALLSSCIIWVPASQLASSIMPKSESAAWEKPEQCLLVVTVEEVDSNGGSKWCFSKAWYLGCVAAYWKEQRILLLAVILGQ